MKRLAVLFFVASASLPKLALAAPASRIDLELSALSSELQVAAQQPRAIEKINNGFRLHMEESALWTLETNASGQLVSLQIGSSPAGPALKLRSYKYLARVVDVIHHSPVSAQLQIESVANIAYRYLGYGKVIGKTAGAAEHLDTLKDDLSLTLTSLSPATESVRKVYDEHGELTFEVSLIGESAFTFTVTDTGGVTSIKVDTWPAGLKPEYITSKRVIASLLEVVHASAQRTALRSLVKDLARPSSLSCREILQ